MKHLKIFEQFSRTIKDLDNIYDYFHLSWDRFNINSDNKSFTFIPRIPETPYGYEVGTIEDDFTKRVSLSDSVINCLYALPYDDEGTWYIYGYKGDNSNIIDTRNTFNNCPIGYGEDFKLNEWIASLSIDSQTEIYSKIKNLEIVNISDLPSKYKNMFYCCVPDAEVNVEYWSLKPITMEYLGYIENYNEDTDDYTNIYDSNILDKIIPKHT